MTSEKQPELNLAEAAELGVRLAAQAHRRGRSSGVLAALILAPWAVALLSGALLSEPVQAQVTETYFYDAQGRLEAAARAPSTGGTLSRYALDNADNRTARDIKGVPGRVAGDRLQAGESLLPSQRLLSSDGRFELKFQSDGNAVIYGPSGSLWHSDTWQGRRAAILTMQPDGNLVMRDARNSPSSVWHSGTFGHPGAYLLMRNDGNLAIYDGASVLWQSNTCCH